MTSVDCATSAPMVRTDSKPSAEKSPPPPTAALGRRRRRGVLLGLLALCLVGWLTWLYVDHTIPEFNQYRLVRSFNSRPLAPSGPRTILLWNDFFGDKRWGLPEDTLGPHFFRTDLKCPVSRCELTNEHDFLPQVDLYDAILFHTAQPFALTNPIPRRRHPRQLYVFAQMEPPGETKHVLGDEAGFYNLTMTYRLDSDVVWPYMVVVDKASGLVAAPGHAPRWRQPPAVWNDSAVWSLWPGKTRMAAWFVSHCDTLSRRERLAAALQQHLEVDVFGKCGPLRCAHNSHECDALLDERYKFYLAFENALCTDYVTEKLFNALRRHVVPVVYGGADYSRFLPPHSYISVEDFASVEELADHLRYLAANPSQYMRYFWWRHHYRLEVPSPFCDLCARLHQPNRQQRSQSYQDIEHWWLAATCRFQPSIRF